MQIDPSRHSTADHYKVLTNLIVPRPIAWVSSQSPGGVVNLAPFSFFNAVGTDPLYIIISIGRNDVGEAKDTANNIQMTACADCICAPYALFLREAWPARGVGRPTQTTACLRQRLVP